MKTQILGAMIGYAAVATSPARIGETLEQCKTRYGEVIMQDKEKQMFSKAGYGIIVVFRNDRAHTIMFTKEEDTPLSENEIKILLNSNSKEWKKSEAKNGNPIWMNAEMTLTATYIKVKDILVIMDKKETDGESDREKENLKDF